MPNSSICQRFRTLRPVALLLCALALLCAAPALAGPAAAAGTGPRVIIDSSPPGAAVYIDGKQLGVRGYTSATFKIRLDKGPHRVLLELEGYKSVEQVINVTQAQKFTFALERAPARLEVKTPGTNDTARGGEVFIDGAPAGTVPVPIEVPAGRHLVEVRKPGFRVFSEAVELRAGDPRTLWVTLQPEARSGSLLISADAQADVFVDGQPRGAAPVLVDNLPEGDHLVEVRRTEPGAPPWRQNVRVLTGQPVKVFAQTQGPPQVTGSLRVLCPVPDAEVIVDGGAAQGKVNAEIGNLRPGQHVIEVRAKGYAAVNKAVDINAGKLRVVQIELQPGAEARGVGMLRVIMVNPVEGAQYFVNGRKYDETVVLSERGMEVPAGQTLLVVRREGFGEVRKELNIRPAALETVTIELRNVGKVAAASQPPGAQVLIDGAPVGQTPVTVPDVPAGSHLIEMRLPGFQTYQQQVVVRGGEQQPVSIQLQRAAGPPPAPPAADPFLTKRGMSSFSAVTIDPGNFTADVGAGYPYFFNVRLNVGVTRKAWFGLDAGAELRTSLYMTEGGLTLRAQLARLGPFAFGANMFIGGGGGPRSRNNFTFEVGVPITLMAKDIVKLTVRPYLQVYSDQLCPTYQAIRGLVERGDLVALDAIVRADHVGDRCTGGEDGQPNGTALGSGKGRYANAILDAAGYAIPGSMPGTQTVFPVLDPTRLKYDPNKLEYQQDGNPVLDRFTGARFLAQAIIEIAISPNASVFGIFEGVIAPQSERQAFTDKFSRVFPERDLRIYGRGGLTFKF